MIIPIRILVSERIEYTRKMKSLSDDVIRIKTSCDWGKVKIIEDNEIEKKIPKDSISILDFSNCKTNSVNQTIFSKFTEVASVLVEGKLIITLTTSTNSTNNWEVIWIEIDKDNFRLGYNTTHNFGFDSIEYKFENHFLKLNRKPPYAIGETIKGEITEEFKQFVRGKLSASNSQTFHKKINGLFQSKIRRE